MISPTLRCTEFTLRCSVSSVICGQHTHQARGVAVELTITREEGKPYFLLRGRPDKVCHKPAMALSSDKIYTWSWDNLKKLIAGQR